METFWRRLKYYGIGFGIGLVFVFVFFKNRGCSWVPSNRVKDSFLERVLVVSDNQNKELRKNKLNHQDIISVLNDGEVLFNQSDKHGDKKVYVLQKDFGRKGIQSFYYILSKESFIGEIQYAGAQNTILTKKTSEKVKFSEKGLGSLIFFPNDDDFIFMDSSTVLSCQLEAIGKYDSRKTLAALKKNGQIDFSESKLNKPKHPKQYLTFKDNKGRTIGMNATWYKKKINILALDLPFESKCK